MNDRTKSVRAANNRTGRCADRVQPPHNSEVDVQEGKRLAPTKALRSPRRVAVEGARRSDVDSEAAGRKQAKAKADPVLEILCRKFPQLKNAMLVGARGDFNTWVERTYRLVDDSYLRIRSDTAGTKIVPIKEEGVLDLTRLTTAGIKKAFG